MEKRQVILRLLVPADQQAAKAIHPGMRPFDHPPARPESRFRFERLGFLPARPNVGGKAEFLEGVAHLGVIIPFVQTHPLRPFLRRLRTLDDDAVDRRAYQFHVVAVRSFHRHPDGHAMAVRQDAPFHPALAAIGRIRTGFFPRPTGLSSSPRPSTANPSRSPALRQRSSRRLATVSGRPPLSPTLGTDHALSSARTIPSGPGLATGNRSVTHRKWRSRSPDPPRAVAHRQTDAY